MTVSQYFWINFDAFSEYLNFKWLCVIQTSKRLLSHCESHGSSSMVILYILDAFFKLSYPAAISSTNESLCQSDSSAPLTQLNSTPAQSYTSQLLETLSLGRPQWPCGLRSWFLEEMFSQFEPTCCWNLLFIIIQRISTCSILTN
jgi:hypothetical protein